MAHGTTGRTIGWAVVIAAPVAAIVSLGLDAMHRRHQREGVVPFRSIHDVPARPPMWRSRSRRPPSPTFRMHDVAAVPPENPHSPPTPPYGVARP